MLQLPLEALLASDPTAAVGAAAAVQPHGGGGGGDLAEAGRGAEGAAAGLPMVLKLLQCVKATEDKDQVIGEPVAGSAWIHNIDPS